MPHKSYDRVMRNGKKKKKDLFKFDRACPPGNLDYRQASIYLAYLGHRGLEQEENTSMGAQGDFTPEMQKTAMENQFPLKIPIDCHVKAYSMLKI